jgi:hypothetical protein
MRSSSEIEALTAAISVSTPNPSSLAQANESEQGPVPTTVVLPKVSPLEEIKLLERSSLALQPSPTRQARAPREHNCCRERPGALRHAARRVTRLNYQPPTNRIYRRPLPVPQRQASLRIEKLRILRRQHLRHHQAQLPKVRHQPCRWRRRLGRTSLR